MCNCICDKWIYDWSITWFIDQLTTICDTVHHSSEYDDSGRLCYQCEPLERHGGFKHQGRYMYRDGSRCSCYYPTCSPCRISRGRRFRRPFHGSPRCTDSPHCQRCHPGTARYPSTSYPAFQGIWSSRVQNTPGSRSGPVTQVDTVSSSGCIAVRPQLNQQAVMIAMCTFSFLKQSIMQPNTDFICFLYLQFGSMLDGNASVTCKAMHPPKFNWQQGDHRLSTWVSLRNKLTGMELSGHLGDISQDPHFPWGIQTYNTSSAHWIVSSGVSYIKTKVQI